MVFGVLLCHGAKCFGHRLVQPYRCIFGGWFQTAVTSNAFENIHFYFFTVFLNLYEIRLRIRRTRDKIFQSMAVHGLQAVVELGEITSAAATFSAGGFSDRGLCVDRGTPTPSKDTSRAIQERRSAMPSLGCTQNSTRLQFSGPHHPACWARAI